MPQMQADKRRPRDRCYPDDSATSADCLPSHTGLQCRPAHTTDCKPPVRTGTFRSAYQALQAAMPGTCFQTGGGLHTLQEHSHHKPLSRAYQPTLFSLGLLVCCQRS